MRAALTYDTTTRLPTTTAVEGKSLNPQPPGFGDLWLSNLHRQLVIDTGQKTARISRGDGRLVSFSGNGSGTFTPAAHVNDRLLSVARGYRFIDASAQLIESYNASGVLTRIDRADGQSLTFTYSDGATPAAVAPGPGYLITITDSFGRSLGFKYSASGVVDQITDPAGQVIAASYSNGNLSQLTWQDAKVRQFLYENSVVSWALTGVVDERNLRKSTFGYDSQRRAISTEYAGGVNKYSVSYSTPPAVVVTDTYDATANMFWRVRSWQAPTAPLLTTPFGTTVNLGMGWAANNPVVTSRSQPAGSGCAASTSSMTYDANGNTEVEDDFNGNRQCRAYDLSRNLTTVRVQGSAHDAGLLGRHCGRRHAAHRQPQGHDAMAPGLAAGDQGRRPRTPHHLRLQRSARSLQRQRRRVVRTGNGAAA
jgi:uncharacterized protein RhaS with RHS repeats